MVSYLTYQNCYYLKKIQEIFQTHRIIATIPDKNKTITNEFKMENLWR